MVYFIRVLSFDEVRSRIREAQRRETNMTNTIAVPAELTTQFDTLTARLTQIDTHAAELVAQRKDVEINLTRVRTAIAYLKGEAIPIMKPEGAKRVMSAEARQRISDGLKASAARKKAAATPLTVGDARSAVEAVLVPEKEAEPVVMAVSTAPAKTGKSAKKGAGK
jgi:hypothetical protein